LFALADACSPGIAFYGRLRTTHNLTAAFGVIVLGALVLAILAPDTAQVSIGHVGVYSLVLALLYLGAARLLFEVDVQARTAPGAGAAPATPLRAAMMTCALTAVAVMLAGLLLAFSAEQIAQRLALADSFVGAMLVAAATSLPEAMTTLAAVRQRAYDIAAGNLLGSNLFNVVVLAIEDVAYLPGPLLADASNVLAAPAVTAMIMTAVIIGALNYVRRTTPRPVDIWVGFALIGLYGFNAWLMFSAAR
jgi:cation:H+ antiporter